MTKKRVLYCVNVKKGKLEDAIYELRRIRVKVARTDDVRSFPYREEDVTSWHVKIDFNAEEEARVVGELQNIMGAEKIAGFWRTSRT